MVESDRLPSDATNEESGADSFLRAVARAPLVSRLPECGQVVAGKYLIQRLLGSGAMGAVFAAHHQLLGQTVALKVMLPTIATSKVAARRFLNEARAMARIEGEHVARVLDMGHLEHDVPFIALELLEGDDLAEVLAQRGRFSQSDAVSYVLQALEAVAQAHALGIVHRDLKPANLFLAKRRDGRELVKVLDFGISKAPNPQTSTFPSGLTQSSAMLGSPTYMSPEQIRDSGAVDARADIWAVGVILFELLTGEPPFNAQTANQLLARILEQEPPPLRTLCPELPEALEAVILRCLAKAPEHRFESVAELALALAPLAPPETRVLVDGIQHIMVGHSSTLPSESGSLFTPSHAAPASKADSVDAARSRPRSLAARAALLALGLALAASVGYILNGNRSSVRVPEVAPSAAEVAPSAPQLEPAGARQPPQPQSQLRPVASVASAAPPASASAAPRATATITTTARVHAPTPPVLQPR